jgi:hypothetical protein
MMHSTFVILDELIKLVRKETECHLGKGTMANGTIYIPICFNNYDDNGTWVSDAGSITFRSDRAEVCGMRCPSKYAFYHDPNFFEKVIDLVKNL